MMGVPGAWRARVANGEDGSWAVTRPGMMCGGMGMALRDWAWRMVVMAERPSRKARGSREYRAGSRIMTTAWRHAPRASSVGRVKESLTKSCGFVSYSWHICAACVIAYI